MFVTSSDGVLLSWWFVVATKNMMTQQSLVDEYTYTQ